jgi:transposase-like protein
MADTMTIDRHCPFCKQAVRITIGVGGSKASGFKCPWENCGVGLNLHPDTVGIEKGRQSPKVDRR